MSEPEFSELAAKEMIEFDPPDMLSAPLTKLFLQAKQLCIKLKHIQKGIIPKGRLGEVLDCRFLGSGLFGARVSLFACSRASKD